MLAVPLILGLAATAALATYLFREVPLPGDISPRSTVLVDIEGREVGVLQAEVGQRDVPLASLPDHVVQSILAAEDASFYDHPGVSVAGIARAVVVNVMSGGVRQGGSTISQQLVKNVTQEDDQTALRKAREAVAALKLERQHTKDEILDRYVNTIYFGRGAYGIEAAAQAYFGVHAVDLDRAQAAQLAGIIPSPSRLDPAENPEGANRRYRYVLDRLVASGWLSPAEAGRLAANRPEVRESAPIAASAAPFFTDVVRRELAQLVGEEQMLRGLTVTTTLDLDAQRAADEIYRESLVPMEAAGAIVALDPATGGIRALVGGEDHGRDQLNLATARPGRAPASTFKVFALAAWIEAGWSPESFLDAPAEMTFENHAQPWEVGNFGGVAYGAISLREATHHSVNTVYGQVAQQVGFSEVVDVAKRAGIRRDLDPLPSLVLGTQEVTPLELAEAYNTFAAEGVRRRATSIVRVEQGDEVLWPPREDLDLGQEAFDPEVARAVTDVLAGVIAEGTGSRAAIGRPAAGKTGTSSNHADAWFAGYTPDLTAVVWMGNRDNNRALPGQPTGGELTAEVWAAFMQRALVDIPARDFTPPTIALTVTRSEPEPEPEPELEPVCSDGEAVVTDPEGALVCAPIEPLDTEPQEGDEADPATEEPDGDGGTTGGEDASSEEAEPEPEGDGGDQAPEPEPEPDEPDPEPEPDPGEDGDEPDPDVGSDDDGQTDGDAEEP